MILPLMVSTRASASNDNLTYHNFMVENTNHEVHCTSHMQLRMNPAVQLVNNAKDF